VAPWLSIASSADVVVARQEGRSLAQEVGFRGVDLTLIATAISEMARNIVEYAITGELLLEEVSNGARRGIAVVARDAGPGIADLDRAMEDGYSTGGSLGLGLPALKRLMDEFEVSSTVGVGTTVTTTKWVP
jgi:serine/threonine-protein kinase RsbT